VVERSRVPLSGEPVRVGEDALGASTTSRADLGAGVDTVAWALTTAPSSVTSSLPGQIACVSQ